MPENLLPPLTAADGGKNVQHMRRINLKLTKVTAKGTVSWHLNPSKKWLVMN
jgi:hypothetical protein